LGTAKPLDERFMSIFGHASATGWINTFVPTVMMELFSYLFNYRDYGKLLRRLALALRKVQASCRSQYRLAIVDRTGARLPILADLIFVKKGNKRENIRWQECGFRSLDANEVLNHAGASIRFRASQFYRFRRTVYAVNDMPK
jgi:hypothetical protein